MGRLVVGPLEICGRPRAPTCGGILCPCVDLASCGGILRASCDATTFCNLASQMCTLHKTGGSGTNILYKTSQTNVQNNIFGMHFAGLQKKRSETRYGQTTNKTQSRPKTQTGCSSHLFIEKGAAGSIVFTMVLAHPASPLRSLFHPEVT